MMENCVRLSKLTDALRGLTGFALNALTEQTSKHDIIALQRSVIQLSRVPWVIWRR